MLVLFFIEIITILLSYRSHLVPVYILIRLFYSQIFRSDNHSHHIIHAPNQYPCIGAPPNSDTRESSRHCSVEIVFIGLSTSIFILCL